MSHQPFEVWLLSEEPLQPDQAAALQAHLERCESCRTLSESWVEVRSLLFQSQPVGPAPGFSARWQARLAAREAKSWIEFDQESSVLFIGISAGIALLLLLALLGAAVFFIDSPLQILLAGLYSLGNLYNSINANENLLIVAAQVLPGILPPGGWIVFGTASSLLILVWIITLQKILLPGRMTP
jgi:hypothetical protein